MIKLRMLNQTGMEEFQKYIQSLRDDESAKCPDLNDRTYSIEYIPAVEIDEKKKFKTRLELGKYLDECFEKGKIKRGSVIDSPRLWTWLAYIYFDQITDNYNRLRETARYICSQDYRDYYRHSVLFPYSIYSLYGENYSKLFLDTELYKSNDWVEQVASRQLIVSTENLVKAIHSLYWDPKGKQAKKGASDRKKPGNIRRFIKLMQQVELTYDIYDPDLAPSTIMDLLPKEFDKWKGTTVSS